jgi:hypothetical protein
VTQNGVAATAAVLINRHTLLRNSESTQGKSATKPQTTRPIVLVIPIMDKRNDA